MSDRKGRVHRVDQRDRGTFHVLGGLEQDGMRFHSVTQNNMQFKIMTCCFTSGIFHSIFLDCGWSLATETMESKTVNKGNDCSTCLLLSHSSFAGIQIILSSCLWQMLWRKREKCMKVLRQEESEEPKGQWAGSFEEIGRNYLTRALTGQVQLVL